MGLLLLLRWLNVGRLLYYLMSKPGLGKCVLTWLWLSNLVKRLLCGGLRRAKVSGGF